MPVIQWGKWSFSFPNSAVGLEATAESVIFQSVLRSYHAELTQVEERSILFPQQFPLEVLMPLRVMGRSHIYVK